jgi:hypothetical protein
MDDGNARNARSDDNEIKTLTEAMDGVDLEDDFAIGT